MKQKSFPLTSFKALDQAQGMFEALVAVFGNVDRAGDRIMPGAFTKSLAAWEQRGRPIPVIFSHDWGNLDAHIGEVREARETPEGLYVKAQLEMDEPFARRVLKKMSRGTLAEFSFAYDVLDSTLVKGEGGAYVNELRELELLEVGPCLVGMNPETQLLGVKKAIASHSTATSAGGWDGPANEARLPSGRDAAFYRRAYAWADPEGDPTVKAAYRFIHHEVDGDGNPGAANVRACQTGIGVLNGGRGGTTIPDEDRQGVWSHLARHLRDADVEPPELKSRRTTDDGRRTTGEKIGRRNSEQDLERIQAAHDLMRELGARCSAEDDGEGEGEDGGEAKGKPPARPSTLAARVAMELLELGYT